ncbi:MAG: hypothetical protein BAA01_01095 [Bacillus thermozeamaize]|uniref:Uncharacterized protein n=1 Tax=Bacillus thermozeamaize TaxID=230954 RepID=A0A1Y3PVS6_9BACI|nr:MAG: hypothetical protein BAA01_01095 [Bacillus thermozeamaize]
MFFSKSDQGAQSAWRGYSSQTLYIASRIISEPENYEFYPEQLEDLLIKQDGHIIEVVQVKDLSSPLTLSHLASTKESKSERGFFKRICSLRYAEPMFKTIRIVYFGELGAELYGFSIGNTSDKKKIFDKLINEHELSSDEASWILSKLVFQKVEKKALEEQIMNQLKSFVSTMAAPELAKTLLVQYVAELSKSRSYTSLTLWQEKIYRIGNDIAAMDGYFKEYQKSITRLCDITSEKSIEELRQEFSHGVSAHPAHIRNNLDLVRIEWLEKIASSLDKHKAVIVKGVSGQGKTALCLRFILNNYHEQLVFCVTHIQSSRQAENLVNVLQGITRHTQDIIVYIDVNPGEPNWTLLLQELQLRGISVPILVSIREEDFKLSKVDSSKIVFDEIDLKLSKEEAQNIFTSITSNKPHPIFRSFEDAWCQFGEEGPFLEFMYLLNNNQTLRQRLEAQIDRLISENVPDSWLMLLNLVCYAGRIGSPVSFENVKRESNCENAIAAIHRMSKEYLIKSSEDGFYIEALHPLRASIICDILSDRMAVDSSEILIKCLKCVGKRYPQLLLMDYFTQKPYNSALIKQIANIPCRDWTVFASMLKTMLWLDVKIYVERNQKVFEDLITKKGTQWIIFSPIDITGELVPKQLFADVLFEALSERYKEVINHNEIERTKNCLTSFEIMYEITDLWMQNSNIPSDLPRSDIEWSDFGYSLFWLAKRKQIVDLPFTKEMFEEAVKYGDIKSKADAMLGLYLQGKIDWYNACEPILRERLISHYNVIKMVILENEVSCEFVPPIFNENERYNIKNVNHFWVMNMVDLLSRLYHDKEYVGAKLVGVDLFGDLGFPAYDSEKRIHRSNLPDPWVTEINRLFRTRIYFSYRPINWQEYNQQVITIRQKTLDLIRTFITSVDYIYRKRFINNERMSKLLKKINDVKKLLHNDILLPKNAVDPYCLYSEGFNMQEKDSDTQEKNSNQIINNKFTLGLSIYLYKDFTKSFKDTFHNFFLFVDRFINILFSRTKGLNYNLKDSELALINIYDSAKSLFKMQQEYSKLFLRYAPEDYIQFEREEVEGMITLLNIAHHVVNNPPRGIAIAYDAKQRYRKIEKLVNKTFEKSVIVRKIIVVENSDVEYTKTMFLLQDCDSLEQIQIEQLFKNMCLRLREQWQDAVAYNSMRWYLETQWPTMVFAPLYKGLPVLGGYRMPLYKILDVNEDLIATPLFPAIIPMEVYNQLDIDFSKMDKWLKAASYVEKLRLLFIQYNIVVSKITSESDICEQGIAIYLENFSNYISDTMTKINEFIQTGIDILPNIEDNVAMELCGIIITSFDEMEKIINGMSSLEPLDELPELLRDVTSSMILLFPYVVENC